MTPNDLSDKALAIFAYAIHHQLSSGETISAVATGDGAGHLIDRGAAQELSRLGLLELGENRLIFTPAGALMLSQLLDRLRGHW